MINTTMPTTSFTTSRKQIAAMSVTGRPFDVRSTVGVGGHPS
jgi:hypothetical protein